MFPIAMRLTLALSKREPLPSHEPADQFYGERSATVKDAAGNFWYIATYKGESYRWEGAPTLQPYLHPLRAEPVINFVKRAFGAEELGRYATPDGVIHHATVKIGNAYMEMGEAHGPYQPMPTMFYLYVEDCDALYKRALERGSDVNLRAPGSSVRRPQRRRNRSLRQQVVHRHARQRHVDAAPRPRGGNSRPRLSGRAQLDSFCSAF